MFRSIPVLGGSLPGSSNVDAKSSSKVANNLRLLTVVMLAARALESSGARGLWASLLQRFSPFGLVVWGTFLGGTLLYWAHSLLLGALELTPLGEKLLLQCGGRRLQPHKAAPSPCDYARCARVVARNQVLVNLPLSLLLGWSGRVRAEPSLPGAREVLANLAVFAAVEECGFYWAHRLLHLPALYRRFHKVHHEFTAPFGLAATYAHWVEHVLSNVLPLLTGPVLLRSHLATLWLWVALATVNTINSHSGYAFPLLPTPHGHDYHHSQHNANYGVLGVLDRLHGTDAPFRRWQARHNNRSQAAHNKQRGDEK